MARTSIRPAGFTELSEIGLEMWGGRIYDSATKRLRGPERNKWLREMAETDDTTTAMLYVLQTIARGVEWKAITPEGMEEDETALFWANHVQSCLHDMSSSWLDTFTTILSFWAYGFSALEIVLKVREGEDGEVQSKHDDGLIGWRKLSLIRQTTIDRWDIDVHGGIHGLEQRRSMTSGGGTIAIPIEKVLLFRTTAANGNPQGRSVLEGAYYPYYYKRHFEEIEGIAIERDLAGYPKLRGPEGVDLWAPENATMLAKAEEFVTLIRRDEREGAVIPFGWEFELMRASGSRQVDLDKTIQRKQTSILMTTASDFLVIGHENVGSYALYEGKPRVFYQAMAGYLQSIADIFNSFGIPRLMRAQPAIPPREVWPRLSPASPEMPNLDSMIKAVQLLTSAGVDMLSQMEIINAVLGQARLPKLLEPPGPVTKRESFDKGGKESDDDDDEEEQKDDDELP